MVFRHLSKTLAIRRRAIGARIDAPAHRRPHRDGRGLGAGQMAAFLAVAMGRLSTDPNRDACIPRDAIAALSAAGSRRHRDRPPSDAARVISAKCAFSVEITRRYPFL